MLDVKKSFCTIYSYLVFTTTLDKIEAYNVKPRTSHKSCQKNILNESEEIFDIEFFGCLDINHFYFKSINLYSRKLIFFFQFYFHLNTKFSNKSEKYVFILFKEIHFFKPNFNLFTL